MGGVHGWLLKVYYGLIAYAFVGIVGIFVATAIPQFRANRLRDYNATAANDLENAYIASQAYFSDYPTGTVDLAVVQAYGFRPSNGTTVTIGGSMAAMTGTSVYNASGTTTYTVDAYGNIQPLQGR